MGNALNYIPEGLSSSRNYARTPSGFVSEYIKSVGARNSLYAKGNKRQTVSRGQKEADEFEAGKCVETVKVKHNF